MTDSYETDAYRKLNNRQGDLEWLTPEEQRTWYAELKGYALEKGYKPGYADCKYMGRFGEWPPRSMKSVQPCQCGDLTRLYLKALDRDAWRLRPKRGRK